MSNVGIYIQRIKQYDDLLLRTLDLEGGLLDKLLRQDVISSSLYESIKGVHSEQKNADLLRFLLTSPDSEERIQKFIDALKVKEYQQEHVANILLENKSGKQYMTEERFNLFTTKYSELRQIIDPNEEFISILVSSNVFNRQDKSRINSVRCFDDKAAEVVNIISKKSDCCFDKFIDALNENDQEHVVSVLMGFGDKRPIRKEWRKLLVKNRRQIIENMSIQNDTLMSESMSEGVFSEYDQQRIVGEKTHDGKVECLVQILMRKSEDKYVRFIDALNNSSQTHVAHLMYGQNVKLELRPTFKNTATEEDKAFVEASVKETLEKVFLRDNPEDNQLRLNVHIQNCISKMNGVNMEVADIETGSIIIVFRCPVESKPHLNRKTFESMSALFIQAFCPLYSDRGLRSLEIVVDENKFQAYVKSLDEQILTKTQSSVLLEQKEHLVSKVRVDSELLKLLPVTRRYRQAIEAENAQEDKARLLISFVERQSQATFEKFIEALKSTHQYDAVRDVEPQIFFTKLSSGMIPRSQSEEQTSATRSKSGHAMLPSMATIDDLLPVALPTLTTKFSTSARLPTEPEPYGPAIIEKKFMRNRKSRELEPELEQRARLEEFQQVLKHVHDAATEDKDLTSPAISKYLQCSTEDEINELFLQLYFMEAVEYIHNHARECDKIGQHLGPEESKWRLLLAMCKYHRAAADSMVYDIMSLSQKQLQTQWKLMKLNASDDVVRSNDLAKDLKNISTVCDSVDLWKERFELLAQEMAARNWKVVSYNPVCTCWCGEKIVREPCDWNIELFRRRPPRSIKLCTSMSPPGLTQIPVTSTKMID